MSVPRKYPSIAFRRGVCGIIPVVARLEGGYGQMNPDGVLAKVTVTQ
jgi:hypothetical protein